jgi:hypothetical protein
MSNIHKFLSLIAYMIHGKTQRAGKTHAVYGSLHVVTKKGKNHYFLYLNIFEVHALFCLYIPNTYVIQLLQFILQCPDVTLCHQ